MSQMVDVASSSLNPGRSEKRVSQYEDLMRKFSAAHKDCKVASIDIPKVHRSEKLFPTGSTYEGTWDVLGMSGTGVYTFPNGVIYRGEFDDGMFHGNGEMQYPSGVILRGKFRHGVMMEKTLLFGDGLEYCDTDWKYCKRPDRRFSVEYDEGLNPAGYSNLTADLPTRTIPDGYYDTGDGFFDPNTSLVFKADDLTSIIRNPSVEEQEWIIQNCRASTVEPLGPRPDLYETWLEPEASLPNAPLPAAATTVTAHLFEHESSAKELSDIDDDEDSDVDVLEDWMTVLKTESISSDAHRRLRFHPSISHMQYRKPSVVPVKLATQTKSVHTKFLNIYS